MCVKIIRQKSREKPDMYIVSKYLFLNIFLITKRKMVPLKWENLADNTLTKLISPVRIHVKITYLQYDTKRKPHLCGLFSSNSWPQFNHE